MNDALIEHVTVDAGSLECIQISWNSSMDYPVKPGNDVIFGWNNDSFAFNTRCRIFVSEGVTQWHHSKSSAKIKSLTATTTSPSITRPWASRLPLARLMGRPAG